MLNGKKILSVCGAVALFIIRKTTRTNFQNEAVRYFYSLPKRSGSFWYKLQWH